MNSIGVVTFAFAIDVPDFASTSPLRFTLRQVPLVRPIEVSEPSSAPLFAIGLACAVFAGRGLRCTQARRTVTAY